MVVHASSLELDHVTRRKPLQGVPVVRLEDTPGAILRDSRAFPATEIFLSTNTGEQKNIILQGKRIGKCKHPTKESGDDKKGSRR
jgi:hypothetical protein